MAGFRYYKFEFTAGNATAIMVAEVELIGRDSGADVTTPSTTVTADGSYSAGRAPSKTVANDGDTTGWQYNAAYPHWLLFDLTLPATLSSYKLTADAQNTYAPTEWTLLGSNDSSVWMLVDSRTGQSFSSVETKTFTLKSLSGVVKDSATTPTKRLVRLHRNDTGEVADETWSNSGTGAYKLITYDDPMKYYALCTDIALEVDHATVVSMPMTGSNNGTTFTEYNGYSVTRTGAITSTTNPPSTLGLASSGYFDGSSKLVLPRTSAKPIRASTDFTAEAWVRGASESGNAWRPVFEFKYGTGNNMYLSYGDSGFGRKMIATVIGTDASNIYSCARTQSSDANTWYHWALVRYLGVCKLYFGGVAQSLNTGANPSTYPLSSWTDTTDLVGPYTFQVGGGFLGNIGPVRVVSQALYTADFTPPTSPPAAFTADTENAQIFDGLIGA